MNNRSIIASVLALTVVGVGAGYSLLASQTATGPQEVAIAPESVGVELAGVSEPAIQMNSPATTTVAETPLQLSGLSYEQRLEQSGWTDVSSEFVNTPSSALAAYVEQYFLGNLQDREFVGAAAWHLAVRSANHMDSVATLESPMFQQTVQYTALSALTMQDSSPVRNLLENFIGNHGEEELTIAIAQWALENFSDTNSDAIQGYLTVAYESADRRGVALNQETISATLAGLQTYRDWYLKTSGMTADGGEVPHA